MGSLSTVDRGRVVSWGRSVSRGRSVGWNWSGSVGWSGGRGVGWSGDNNWCWGIGRSGSRGIGRLDLSWVDSFTFILNISNISVLISSVGHNLDAGVRKDNTIRTASLVSITGLSVAKVVGVGVTDSILKSILWRNIRINLHRPIGWIGSWGWRSGSVV